MKKEANTYLDLVINRLEEEKKMDTPNGGDGTTAYLDGARSISIEMFKKAKESFRRAKEMEKDEAEA